MSSSWQGLLANFALVALIVSIWTHVEAMLDRRFQQAIPVILGLVFGLGAVALMLLPIRLEGGIYVDLRIVPVVLSGVFGGPVASLIAALLAGAYRWQLAGAGMLPGLLNIGLAAIISIVAHRALDMRVPSATDMLRISALASISGIPSILMLPVAILHDILLGVTLPLIGAVFVGTTIAGMAISNERKRTADARTNHIYRAIIDALPDSLNVKDLQGRFIAANPATARLMRAGSAENLIGKSDFDFYPEETAKRFLEEEYAALAAGGSSTIEQIVTHHDGDRRWLSTLKTPFHDRRGVLMGLITHNRDITEKKRLAADLAISERRLSDAMANMADALVVFEDGRLVFCNELYRTMFPLTADVRIPGSSWQDIFRAAFDRGEEDVPYPDADTWIAAFTPTTLKSGSREIKLKDGRWIEGRMRRSRDGQMLVVYSDITKSKRQEAELLALNTRLERLASTDGLTGLANRRAFDEALETCFEAAARTGIPASVLLIDVDRFKAFNDTYGHQSGDECLKCIARLMQTTCAGDQQIAARYGGEELAIILPNTTMAAARAVAESLRLGVCSLNISHAASELRRVTVSIGVAQTGPALLEPVELLRAADDALYQAKATGRDRVRTADPPPPLALAYSQAPTVR